LTITASVASPSTFSVTQQGGGILPDKIKCDLSRSTDNVLLQTVTIDVSGDIALNLGDEFGAFKLEACDELSCIEVLNYDVTATNVGTNSMEITNFTFAFDGHIDDLLPAVTTNPLQVGQSTTVGVIRQVDICMPATFLAEVAIEANPPGGMSCEDMVSDTTQIGSIPPTPAPTPIACDVDAVLTCRLDNGADCTTAGPPDSLNCATGPIDDLTFTFTGSACVTGSNSQGAEASCTNVMAFTMDTPVQLTCTDNSDGSELTITSSQVDPSTFTVTEPGATLPAKIKCDLFNSMNQVLQTNIIDTSGSVPLALGDEFGAFLLQSCEDISCIETLNYDASVANVGTNQMTVTNFTFAFDGHVDDLLPAITPVLQPGDSTAVGILRQVSVCDAATFLAEIDVEANPPGGIMCQDDEDLQLGIPEIAPTDPPTASPTVNCELELEVLCVLGGDGPLAGQPCETPGIGIEPCLERPTAATMLYNGGDCSQSDNRQFLQFTCEDFNGGPPNAPGSRAYIIVTDIKGDGIVYHRDFVTVGDNYDLRTPDGEGRFEADQRIQIYSSDVTSQANLLQDVVYHSSCSSNLELKNRFGASQLVQFFNSEQGNVTCFNAAAFDFDIRIPITIIGESIRLESLTVLTSFDGFVDLTDQVANRVVNQGDEIAVTLSVTFDLTVRQRYTLFTQLAGTSLPGGEICRGQDFDSFFAGNPIAPGQPTPPPTPAPTISPAPTPDVQTTPCSIGAEISCVTLDDQGRILTECDDVIDPRTIVCTDDLEATGIGFQYSGTATDPDQVWITISGGRTGTVFNGPVSRNQFFYAEGDFRGEIDVTVSNVNNGAQGNRIEDFSIDGECQTGDDTLRLTNRFGLLELTAFRNALGVRTSVRNTRLQYIVSNESPITLTAQTANINSAFRQASFDALADSDPSVAGRASVVVFEEERVIDFGDKFSAGVEFSFAMDVTGVGSQSNLGCTASDTFSF